MKITRILCKDEDYSSDKYLSNHLITAEENVKFVSERKIFENEDMNGKKKVDENMPIFDDDRNNKDVICNRK